MSYSNVQAVIQGPFMDILLKKDGEIIGRMTREQADALSFDLWVCQMEYNGYQQEMEAELSA